MKQTDKNPERKSLIQNISFGAILIILFILVCRLFAPFFTVLLWSILLYVLLNPLHSRVTSKLERTKHGGMIVLTVWAAVFSVGTVVIILLPLSFVGFQFYKQILELIHMARDFLASHSGQETISGILKDMSLKIAELSSGQIEISADEIQARILGYISSGLQYLIRFSRNFMWNVGSFVAGLMFMIFSLFFFYLDGPYLLRLATRVIPIKNDYMKALVNKFKEITKNLVLGYIMVALIQSALAYIIFSVFSIKGALVFAALTFICVFIPIIGGGVIWLPLGIIKLLTGTVPEGIAFLVISGIFISTLDNVIRPLFLRNQIQLHPLIIFFAILGGLKIFGFNGIILGPMVVILFLTVLDLFLRENKIEQDQQ